MSRISKVDTLRHRPEQDDPSWQESFFLGWCDITSNSGGSHHISLCPHLGLAHVWSWTIVGGERVARFQEHRLSLPDRDFDDMQLGSIRFASGDDLRKLSLRGEFERGELSLAFDAYTDPLELDFQAGGLKLGSSHYECMGRITGEAAFDGNHTAVAGVGWHDHSWGPRKFRSNPTGRWFYAVFGDDLAFSVYSLGSASGTVQFGYVLDHGAIAMVRKVQFRARMADDGISPLGCDALIWTHNGRGYRVKGEVSACALTGGTGWSGDTEFFTMDGLAQFECGGRLGQGFLEVTEARALTPEMRKELKLT